MRKKFNITGLCYPHLHYMMDVSKKKEQVMAMVEAGEYFIINRPRQYGKTTMLYLLGETLNEMEEYLPIEMNFQGIDSQWHESDKAFAQMFINQLQRYLKYTQPTAHAFIDKQKGLILDMDTLSDCITALIHLLSKKIVLIIDEVDASSTFDPFLSFLGMLRTKYLARSKAYHATFHSIVLAGVHDIKTLKYKIRKDKDSEQNSPWNIATDFKVRMSFIPDEIAFMLNDYCQAEGVKMDIASLADQLYYYTSGYPFLVSKLCKSIAEDIISDKEKDWRLKDLETAIQLLLKENSTNFDSLIKNLENNQSLYNLVYRVIIDGENIPFNPDESLINLGRIYGIFKANGTLKIHNRIYEQRLYNYMTVKTIVAMPKGYNYAGHFLLANNALDIKATLLKFQQFRKEQHSKQQIQFLEEQGRIIFLSFLAPILNGNGYSFKEVQTSLEKRLDVVITYFQHRYIIELKRWYGPKAHQEGLNQLADYLKIHGVKEGYLVPARKL